MLTIICIAVLCVDIFGPAMVSGADEFVNCDLAVEVVVVTSAEVCGSVLHTAVGISTAGKVPT